MLMISAALAYLITGTKIDEDYMFMLIVFLAMFDTILFTIVIAGLFG